MKIPSEAELIEMERRIGSADGEAGSMLSAMIHKRYRIDSDELELLSEMYARVAADLESLIELVRAGALCAR